MPPKKKGRAGLIIGIAVVLLIIIIGGIVAVVLLGGKKNNNNASNGSTSTPTVAATATQSVPSGFKTFSNGDFSIIYPQDWTAQADSSGVGENFAGPSGQAFDVSADQNGSDPTTTDSLYCTLIGDTTAGPTTVTIGGAQWTQEECEDKDGTLHSVIESVSHNGKLFSIFYLSIKDAFPADKTQFYQPMEQSFQFKG